MRTNPIGMEGGVKFTTFTPALIRCSLGTVLVPLMEKGEMGYV
jgi:hypothetical protein